MEVPHEAWVVVTDGRKALLLRNEGDARFSNLQLLQKWQQRVGADRKLKSDGPGRSFSAHDGRTRRSAYSQTNFHDLAEDQFVSEIARMLHRKASGGDLRQLVIVAPPRALGDLRKHLNHEVSDLVVAEIPKDLVKHPIAEIEHLLAQYIKPGVDVERLIADHGR